MVAQLEFAGSFYLLLTNLNWKMNKKGSCLTAEVPFSETAHIQKLEYLDLINTFYFAFEIFILMHPAFITYYQPLLGLCLSFIVSKT